MDEMRENFKNPPRKYAIYPIIHGGMADNAAITERLLRQGFAGAVGNVPYADNFPDDESEWENTEKGFRRLCENGLESWIYDEKGYPSGSAGGAVIERNPDFTAKGLYCYEYWRTLSGPSTYRADSPGDKLHCAMLLPLDGGEAIDVTSCANERGTLHLSIPAGEYHLFMMSERRLFDGTHAAESYSEPRDCISLSDAEATREFINVTHENYFKRLGDSFGHGIRAFFTDEPSLISWNIRAGVYPIVPWHKSYPSEFLAAYGYPIEYAVVAVVTKRGPAFIKRRCDFWEFVGESVAKNYFGQIQDWCRAHGIKSSGHMLEEERLQSHVYCYGSMYKCARRLDWPGIDQLNSEPRQLMSTGCIPIARFLASFADLSGEHEVFTEFSDHSSRMSGVQIGIEWIYASLNWHFAMGVNNMTSYYDFSAFSDEQLRALNLYCSRLGCMLRIGSRDSRVALLYPESSMWAYYTPSTEVRAIDRSPETAGLDAMFAKISWELLHRQIDFDYVDEGLICGGVISDGKLRFGDRGYETVVLAGAKVLSERTVKRLTELLDAGIGVVLVGELPVISRDTGLDGGFEALFTPYLSNPKLSLIRSDGDWTIPERSKIPALSRPIRVSPGSLGSILRGAEGSGQIVGGEAISDAVLSHTRATPDGKRLIFLCNMSGKNYGGTLSVDGGKSARLADPATGLITDIENSEITRNGKTLLIPFELKFYQGKIFIIS